MRATRTLQAFLVFAVLSSVVHYADNTIRFDQYPQDEPKLITRPLVPVSWALFTVFAYLGYRWYREGRYTRAAAALAFYSISGLISPLHYTSGALDEFDGLQHAFIATDGIAGLLVAVFAFWLLGQRESGTPQEAWQTSR